MRQQLHRVFNAKILLLLIGLSGLYSVPNSPWAAEESLDAENNTATHHLPNIPQKRAQSLIHHMELMDRQDEVVQLSNSVENYYGLYLADMTGNPQGGVLILHDNQQHGHWPDIVAPLREYLPQHGWATLTIELPDSPARKRIPRQDLIVNKPISTDAAADTEATDESIEPIATNEEGDEELTEDALDNNGPDSPKQKAKLEEDDEAQGDDSLEPALPRLAKLPDLAKESLTETAAEEEKAIDPSEQYRKQNQQRIRAAMDYLRNQGQLNLVIIGYGVGAAWAIDHLHQQNEEAGGADDTLGNGLGNNLGENANNNANNDPKNNKGLTLVTIDAMPSRHTLLTMKQQLKKMNLPFLDLIQPNKRDALRQGKTRQAIMKRNKNENYQQIITTDITSYHNDENPTNRRIRGWLKTNAGGTLVNIKR